MAGGRPPASILRYLAARLAAIPRCCRVPKTNDFRIGARGPNTVLRRANALTKFLAAKLTVPGTDLCDGIAGFQPNNLVGHAFRSLTVHILETFGDRDITYAEEVRPYDEFPGQQFTAHSATRKSIPSRSFHLAGVTDTAGRTWWKEPWPTLPPPNATTPVAASMRA